jgi:putative transposase
MRDICERENIAPNQVVLHSDNGGPMKGATMLATLQTLGVMPSFSRPAVSNDNPFSESLFKTMKYRPTYPERPFENLFAARQWVGTFVHWYNEEHRHSAIGFVTPAQRHARLDAALLAKRVELYEAARARHPERWSGATRNWQPVTIVYLNPEKPATKKTHRQEQNLEQKKASFKSRVGGLAGQVRASARRSEHLTRVEKVSWDMAGCGRMRQPVLQDNANTDEPDPTL